MTGAPDFWTIPFAIKVIFYVLATIAVLVFLAGFWYKARVWSKGRDVNGSLQGRGPVGLMWLSVVKLFSADCFLGRRVFPRSVVRGIILVAVMWTFVILFLGTVGRALNTYIYQFLVDNVWLVFSAVLEVAGLLLLLGVIYALIRRYVFKPERMATSIQDGVFLLLIFFIIVTGFLMEGVRLVVIQPPALDWSYVGYAFGVVASGVVGGNLAALQSAYPLLWLVHIVAALGLIAYIPFSKAFHIFASQLTTYLAAERKRELEKALPAGTGVKDGLPSGATRARAQT